MMKYHAIPETTPIANGSDDGKTLEDLENEWFEESQLHFSSLKWYRRPSKWFLFVILFIHTLSFTILMGPLVILMLDRIKSAHPAVVDTATAATAGGMHMAGHSMQMPKPPPVPPKFFELVKRMNMGGGMGNGNPEDQKELSNVQAVMAIISGLLGFTLSGKFGQLSDKYGRVYVFKLFSVINLIHTVSLIVYFQFIESYSRFWLIIFASTGFLSGGVMALISNGNSYINDIVDAKDRTITISLLMAFVYSALGVGPLLGSFSVKIRNDNLIPLWISLIFGVISTVLVFTFMVETRNPKALEMAKTIYNYKNTLQTSSNNRILDATISVYKKLLSFFKPIKRFWLPRTAVTKSLIPRINIITLVIIDIFAMAVTFGIMSVLILYTILKYQWSSIQIGYYMSINGFGKALALLIVAPLLLKFLQTKAKFEVLTHSIDKNDKFSIVLSMVFIVFSLMSVLFIHSSTGIYLSSALQCISGLISPTIQSAIVKYSNKTEAGEMFGAIALVRHLAMLFIPALFLQIYSHTVNWKPEFVFYIPFIGSILLLLLAIFSLRIYKEEDEVLDDEFVVE